MAEKTNSDMTLALDTKVEKEFVAPLTTLRANLEILRDFPDLDAEERQKFLETAILACTRLEKAVEDLGTAVYSAGRQAEDGKPDTSSTPKHDKRYAERIAFLEDIDAVEIDFSGFEFTNSQIVNDFHDVVEEMVEATGRKWYFIVNYRDCSIWPEAWVAFAHRGKKVNANYSLGTVRYVETEPEEGDGTASFKSDDFDPDMFPSRELALAKLEDEKRKHSVDAPS